MRLSNFLQCLSLGGSSESRVSCKGLCAIIPLVEVESNEQPEGPGEGGRKEMVNEGCVLN